MHDRTGFHPHGIVWVTEIKKKKSENYLFRCKTYQDKAGFKSHMFIYV